MRIGGSCAKNDDCNKGAKCAYANFNVPVSMIGNDKAGAYLKGVMNSFCITDAELKKWGESKNLPTDKKYSMLILNNEATLWTQKKMICVHADTFCGKGTAEMNTYGITGECMGTPTFETYKALVSTAVQKEVDARDCSKEKDAQKTLCENQKSAKGGIKAGLSAPAPDSTTASGAKILAATAISLASIAALI